MLENVVGFASSNGGQDLYGTIQKLNELGYACDILTLDAARFLPQSRPRLFIVGVLKSSPRRPLLQLSDVRPQWIIKFMLNHPQLTFNTPFLPPLPNTCEQTLNDSVERFPENHSIWWDSEKLDLFLSSLSAINVRRLDLLRRSKDVSCASAYRRTRYGKPVWEIRPDSLSGCLRTARGGSSRQALVEAGRGEVRVRWMTAREYSILQGAPKLIFGNATESQAKFALGDAVCVPVIEWLGAHYLIPAVRSASPKFSHSGHND